jgi:quercetin dioxygenase-like cupin family protein
MSVHKEVEMENVVTLADVEPRPVPENEGHHGGRIWYVFNKDTMDTESLRVVVQEYRPGGYTEGHGSHLDREQAYYILSGTMTVTISGRQYVAGPGSFVYIPRGADHDHLNSGPDNLVFLTIVAAVRSGDIPPLRTKK